MLDVSGGVGTRGGEEKWRGRRVGIRNVEGRNGCKVLYLYR